MEFSDWASVKNACIAMLLAFLSHFRHAVPSSVLRDLRRAFHKHEGDGAWTMASPAPAVDYSSAAPEPSPSASPLRLSVPEVGGGSPMTSCAWMGRDRESSRTGEVGLAMVSMFRQFIAPLHLVFFNTEFVSIPCLDASWCATAPRRVTSALGVSLGCFLWCFAVCC